MRIRCTIVGLLLGVTLGAPGQVTAQGGRPLMAFGRQDLAFGALLPGVGAIVSRFDGLRAGRFEVRGQRFAEVQITLVLPAAMTSAGGNTIPLQFAAGDGGISDSPDVATSTAFDPQVPIVTALPSNGVVYLWLGGTALPGGQQPAGSYAATITVTAAYTGN